MCKILARLQVACKENAYGNNFATSVNVLLEYVNTVFMDFIDMHNTFRMFVHVYRHLVKCYIHHMDQ